jgi:hypothetical protein
MIPLTILLPRDDATKLGAIAQAEGRSVADLIRDAVTDLLDTKRDVLAGRRQPEVGDELELPGIRGPERYRVRKIVTMPGVRSWELERVDPAPQV